MFLAPFRGRGNANEVSEERGESGSRQAFGSPSLRLRFADAPLSP